jgi:PadR family transcriptional regulator, regulatory protein PadR
MDRAVAIDPEQSFRKHSGKRQWNGTAPHRNMELEARCQSDLRNRMRKTKADHRNLAVDRALYSGMMRLHVLHHATVGPILGLGVVEELALPGYRISPGTLYPMLHRLEKKGYMSSIERRNGESLSDVYRPNPLGRKALAAANAKVREFIGELMEGQRRCAEDA